MSSNPNLSLAPLITQEALETRVRELVDEIAHELTSDELVVVGLLKGSFMFMADLARLLHAHGIPLIIDFMIASSYGAGTTSSGNVELSRDITTHVTGQNVLLVDDILDTGRTMDFTIRHLREKQPALLKTCVFLDKPDRRVIPIAADHVGFTIPDEFVVGYGLDYNSRYRELPYLSTVSFDGEPDTD